MKKVLLISWDAYPNYASGGIYTWTKTLIDSMQELEFVVINQLSNPNGNGKYSVPNNVTKVIEIPIFGTNRYEEFYDEKRSLLLKILRTTESVIKNEFMPLYKKFLNVVLSEASYTEELIEIIWQLHQFLTIYDSKKCFEYNLVWDSFINHIKNDRLYENMSLKETLTAFQLISRSMQVLSFQVPKVDIIHSSLAWLPSMIAIFAKRESNCPVIITEHGVAFRELLLYYNAVLYDEPAKIFWKFFSRNITRAMYSIADVITPVCVANAAWEKDLGTDPAKIKVIYNGVNIQKFCPMEIKREDDRPTVVSVGRIEPYKDIVCLIRAIGHVKEVIPNIQCLIYGRSTDLEYSIKCVDKIKSLNLADNVKFMGGTNEPEKAYNSADVIAFSSITEGFPFSIIEAMACGKAVVAADVGGVREALEGCGLLVRSMRPKDLANGIITLLNDEQLRKELGEVAIKKVKDKFTIEKTVEQIKKLYEDLINSFEVKKKTKLAEVVVQ